MTPEQIEQRAKELYPFRYGQRPNKRTREAYITGALSRQPEIDALQERVKELEEGLILFLKSYERDYPTMCKNGMSAEYNTAKQLLTNKPNNNG